MSMKDEREDAIAPDKMIPGGETEIHSSLVCSNVSLPGPPLGLSR